MRYLSVCSGIEAASVAWHHLGWQPVGFSEIEAFPSAVLAHRFPNVPNFGDMTRHAEWNLGPGSVDLLVGGTPCQSFSVAGLRRGLSDPRGGLMLTYLEIAQRLRPRWLVWENVPGVLSSGSGRDLGAFLGALGELGYGWAYRVLDAQWVRTQRHPRAVPQRRRRIFVVGCLGDPTAAASVLFESQSVQRDSAPRRATREEPAADAGVCAASVCSKWSKGTGEPAGDECQNLTLQPVASTLGNRGLRSHTELDGHGAYIPQPVPFTKSKRAQSATDDETWVEGAVNPTLSLFDQGDVRATTVAVAFAQNQVGEVRTGAVAGTVNTNSNPSGRNTPMVAVAFKPGQSAEARSLGAQEGVACTLEAGGGGNNKQAVAYGTDCYNGAITGDVAATMGTPGSSINASGPTVMQAVAHAFYSTGGTHGVNQHPEVSPAVKVGSGIGIPSPPAVAHTPMTVIAFTCKDHGGDASSISPTMRSMSHDGSHANGGGQVAVAHTLRAEGFDASEDGTGRGTPLVPVQSLQQQGYNGDHASTQEANAIATLRVLRDEIGEEAFAAWGLGVLDSLQPSQVLRSRLHGKGIRCATFSRSWPIDCAISRPEDRAAWAVQSVREAEGEGCSPSRRELPQQLAGQLGAYLSQLPCPGPQAERLMHHLWCSGEGVGILRQALSEIQEARRPVDVSRPTSKNAMTVRRLTATECEFLQGFPRNWTMIPWRKKTADDCPDGPRYKALGNSMAVNVMAWIGERIDNYERTGNAVRTEG